MTGDGQTLVNRQRVKIREMNRAIDTRLKAGIRWAQLQAVYRVALCKAIAKLRDGGTAAALASTMAKGQPDIAKAEFEMEEARVKYELLQETINAAKVEINILEGQIQREWGRKG